MYSDIKRIGELSNDGVFIYDIAAKKFVYLNNAFASIFNCPPESILEDSKVLFPAIYSEDIYYLQHSLQLLKTERTVSSTEFRLEQHETGIKHLSCDAYLLTDTLITGFVKDVTLMKQHEDFIINYGAKKDTLLDMMTHNLSGPLVLSQNILSWIQKTFKDKTPGEISSQLHMIQDNTQECLDIVNDFLRQEHQESQRVYVKKTRFDVVERIVATLEKLIATNKNKKFRIITACDNLNINTDSVKFFQIVHNLLSNALKFTPDNGEIDIIVEELDTTFIIKVRDNGIGIPLELHEKIFEEQLSSGRGGLNNEKSSGLGLTIVKKLTSLLDGKVGFESEENKGSIFFIELPKD